MSRKGRSDWGESKWHLTVSMQIKCTWILEFFCVFIFVTKMIYTMMIYTNLTKIKIKLTYSKTNYYTMLKKPNTATQLKSLSWTSFQIENELLHVIGTYFFSHLFVGITCSYRLFPQGMLFGLGYGLVSSSIKLCVQRTKNPFPKSPRPCLINNIRSSSVRITHKPFWIYTRRKKHISHQWYIRIARTNLGKVYIDWIIFGFMSICLESRTQMNKLSVTLSFNTHFYILHK